MQQKQSRSQYITHMLNYSPSKMAYSFSRKQRFQTEGSTNQHYRNVIINKINISKELQKEYKQKQNKEKKKQQKKGKQAEKYQQFEFRVQNKKDDYKIFPVRRDLGDLIKDMQELRIFFKTQLQLKKHKKMEKRWKGERNNPQISHRWLSEDILVKDSSRKQKKLNDFDRLQRKGKIVNQKNPQISPRKQTSSFGNFLQSNYRNTASYSFATSPKNLMKLQSSSQGQTNYQLYRPFSEFGNLKKRSNLLQNQ